ncbi:MAG TPA: MurR/RpiR family transcriptional regulator, partial [Paenalcaligenes sp.]|nr:MurR/RpiR family transcriptional regulator [Paenalcaligenes sp.]
MQAPSFLSRVRALLPELHPAERRLGDFVCDFPGELASFSASELAELAHVSKATVTRFVKRLGYENYEEARRHARAERSTGSRFFLASSTDVSNEQSI